MNPTIGHTTFLTTVTMQTKERSSGQTPFTIITKRTKTASQREESQLSRHI